MFKRFYGENGPREYIHGFLFDLERQISAGFGDGESGRVWSPNSAAALFLISSFLNTFKLPTSELLPLISRQ
jgi:hypothetical protein